MAWLYKRPDSERWWIGYRANGKQFLKSTKTTDRKEAEKELARVESLFRAHSVGMLEEVYQALSGKTLQRVTLKASLEQWLAEVSAGTRDRYASIAEEFATYLGASDRGPLLAEVTTDQCRDYLNQRRKKCSANTTNLERKILSVFFRRAMKNQQLRDNPTFPIRPYPADEETQQRRAFTLEELRLIYRKAPNEFWKYMILGGSYSGLRLGDLITLAWPSIDFVENFIRLTPKKTKRLQKTIHVPIAAPFRAFLLELFTRAGKPKSGFIWPEQAAAYREKGAIHPRKEHLEAPAVHLHRPVSAIETDEAHLGSGRQARGQRVVVGIVDGANII